MANLQECELCRRQLTRLTKHHLIPKTRHKNKKNKKNFDRQEIHDRVIWICRPCHSNIHAVFSEKELEYEYNSLEALQTHPMIQKFSAWIHNKPEGTRVPHTRSKRRS